MHRNLTLGAHRRRSPALLCASIAVMLSGCPDPEVSADAFATIDAQADRGDVGDGGRLDRGPIGGEPGDGGGLDRGPMGGEPGDGGQTDGGQTDGGQTDGGQTDGGQTDGGGTDGGQTDGMMPDASVVSDVRLLDVVADGCGSFACVATGPMQSPIELLDADVRWTLNGDAINGGARLEGAAVANDDILRCHVQTAVAGVVQDVASPDHVVALPALTLASLTLRPLEPVVGERLECLPFGVDAGRCGADPSFTYAWRVNGALVAGADQARLNTDALLGGETAQCEVQVELAGRVGAVVTSNEITLGLPAVNLPEVELEAPDGADGDLTCAVLDARGVNVALGTWVWQINDGAAFTAEAVLDADRVRSCDRVRCWFELNLGAETLRSNRPELLLPLGGDCGAADVCGVAVCHPDGGCAIDAQSGVPCDSGDACVVDGQCAEGVCVGRALRCDDGDPCTTDQCSPVNGCIALPATGAACDDGDACTADDTCVAGTCAGTPICECEVDGDCATANPCVDATCEAGACVLANNADACDDGDACTADDACVAGLCVGQALERVLRFRDADDDGFGLANDTVDACGDVPGYGAEVAGDCDDGDAQVNPDGEELSDDGRDSNCDGFELFAGNRLQLGGPINTPTYDVAISGEFDLGEVGLQVVEGRTWRTNGGPVQWTVSAVLDHDFGDVRLSGARFTVTRGVDGRVEATVAGRGAISLFPIDDLRGTFALTPAPADYAIEAAGDVTIEGQNGTLSLGRDRSFARRVNGASDWQLELEVGGLDLAPGVEFTGARFIANAEGVSVHAGVELGAPPTGVALEVRGMYTVNGPLELSLGLAEGATWAPLGDDFPLAFDTLVGRVVRDADGAIEASVTASIDVVALAPGLALTDASVTGTIDDAAAWSVSIAGAWTVDFGDDVDRRLFVTGDITADELALAGETPDAFEPLAALLGDGRFVIAATDDMPFAVGVTLNRVDESVAVTFDAPFSLCAIGACDADSVATGTVHASGTIDAVGFNGIFRGLIEGLELPLLGELPALALVATTEATDDVDLFGDGEVERDLIRGVTLAVRGESPIPLEGLGEVLFILSLGPDGLDVEADFGLEVPIIRPEDDFPTITHVTLDRVFFFAELRVASAEMGIASSVVFQPSNQAEELRGNVRLGVTSAGDASGEMNIEGRWIEPAGLRNFAVQNPGFTLKLNFAAAGIPVPTSFGWNFDLFWKKNGDWPAAVPMAGEPTPPNLLALGSSFFYDKTPTDGTFCPVGVCPPSPPFLVRFTLENLTLDDVVAFINDATAVALDAGSVVAGALGETVPEAGLLPLDPSPVSIEVHRLSMSVATHDIELLGQPFEAGVAAELDVTVQDRNTSLSGRLDAEGLALRGQQDGFSVLGVTLVGDPLWRALDVSGDGALRLPGDPRLDLEDGTVELWINGADLCAEDAEILDKPDSMRLSAGACVDGRARLIMEYGSGPGRRTIRTVPVVESGEDVHIAVVFFGEQVSLFVDGARAIVDSDDRPGQVLAVNANRWTFGGGGGVDRIDDVRIWGTRLSAADLTAHARRLPTRILNPRAAIFPDSPLVARYEFDFDDAAGRNSREYAGGPTLGGTFRGGAAPVLRVDDNPVQFSLALAAAGAEGRAPGVGVTAGVDVDIPLIPQARFTMAIDGLVGGGDSRVAFYARTFELMPIGLRANDTYVGSLYIGGNGRNLINDGGLFDDGAYGEFDLEEKNFAGSARFEFLNEDTNIQQRFVEGDFAYNHASRYLYVNAFVDLTFPFLGGEAGLAGEARYNEADEEAADDAEHAVIVTGDLVLFNQEFAGLEFEVSTEQIRFNTDWNVPVPGLPEEAIVGLEAEYIVSFADRNFCATARPMVAGQQCDLQVCFFSDRAPDISGCGLPECGDGACFGLIGVEQCGFGDSPDGRICQSDCGLCNPGSFCDNDNDCESGDCFGAVCAPDIRCGDDQCAGLIGVEQCGNGDSNDGRICESDCGLCNIGSFCDDDNDCESGNCFGAACVPEVFCGDDTCVGVIGVEQCGNGDSNDGRVCESDCGLCNVGSVCDNDNDCESGNCFGAICVPEVFCGDDECVGIVGVEQCGDGDSNDGRVCESDCGLCNVGSVCNNDDDCRSGNCFGAVCVPEVFCGDDECVGIVGVEQCGDGDSNDGRVCESDCGLCNVGSVCNDDNDCESGNCLGAVCAPRCGDGVCHATEFCADTGRNGFPNCNADCGTCECANDGDCPDDEWCDGNSVCRVKRATGEQCSRPGQCEYGRCPVFDGRCGDCVNDNDCADHPGGPICKTGQNPNVCDGQPLGSFCRENRDCDTDQCSFLNSPAPGLGRCSICDNDNDCPAGRTCEDVGAFDACN